VRRNREDERMGRSLRVEYVGALYHVMNRGNARGMIFRDEKDYEFFKQWMGTVCGKAGWKVHAWTLMPNHYHLLIEIRRKTLITGMQLLNAEYTRHFNRRYRLSGPLFQGRYKATLVEGKVGYLRTVVDYIHLNLARAKICRTMEALVEHPQTSVGCYVRGRFPEWMEWRGVMAASTGRERMGVGDRKQFYGHLEGRLREMGKADPEWKQLRRSWCWAGDSLREKFKKAMVLMRGKSGAGEIWQRGLATETEESLAERLLGNWEKREGKGVEGLGIREKHRLGLWIREESCVGVGWLVKRLGVRSANTLQVGMSTLRRNKGERERLSKALRLKGTNN
jgi:REP element-mobilizing transposase RayT